MIQCLALAEVVRASYTLARTERVSDKKLGYLPMYVLPIFSTMAHLPCS